MVYLKKSVRLTWPERLSFSPTKAMYLSGGGVPAVVVADEKRLRQAGVRTRVPAVVGHVVIALGDAALGVAGINRDSLGFGARVPRGHGNGGSALGSGIGVRRRGMGIGQE